jgi:hypothetical protein
VPLHVFIDFISPQLQNKDNIPYGKTKVGSFSIFFMPPKICSGLLFAAQTPLKRALPPHTENYMGAPWQISHLQQGVG